MCPVPNWKVLVLQVPLVPLVTPTVCSVRLVMRARVPQPNRFAELLRTAHQIYEKPQELHLR
jgi:hypothetical protein